MIFYDLSLLALMVIFFPKMVWQLLFQGKYRKSFSSRLSKKAPHSEKKAPVIWLHGVSVGETKALSTLVPHIRKTYPSAFIVVSTVTETGQKEAKRLITQADEFCYLPLDFSWIIRPFVKRLKPSLLILVEGDFWYHLLKEVKQSGGSVVVVNGKMSERSFKRFSLLKSFRKALFEQVDTFCVQSKLYFNRFIELGIDEEKLCVIGNLKYDISLEQEPLVDQKLWKEKLGIQKRDFVLTVGSTHEGEEAFILKILKSFWSRYPHLKMVLAPRHPERVSAVKKLLKKEGLSFWSYLAEEKPTGKEKVILIDGVGILPRCYRIADLAIVGGSFIPGIGGHDIFEPAKMGIPPIFGPYMDHQLELVQKLTEVGIGKQTAPHQLPALLETYFSNPDKIQEEGAKGIAFAKTVSGSSFRTWKKIEQYVTSS
jgi:3-deoxy-D-manno-octulosonic-acid transferase